MAQNDFKLSTQNLVVIAGVLIIALIALIVFTGTSNGKAPSGYVAMADKQFQEPASPALETPEETRSETAEENVNDSYIDTGSSDDSGKEAPSVAEPPVKTKSTGSCPGISDPDACNAKSNCHWIVAQCRPTADI